MFSIAKKMRSMIWVDAAAVAICLATTVLAYLIAVSPCLEQRHLSQMKQQEFSSKKGQLAEIRGSVNELKTRLHTLSERLAETNIELASPDMVNSKVAVLTALLTDCSLEVDDVNIGQVTSGKHCEIVPIQISGRGDYVQCAQFLHNLSGGLPDIHLSSLNLRRNPSGLKAQHKFTFDLIWYTSAGEEPSA